MQFCSNVSTASISFDTYALNYTFVIEGFALAVFNLLPLLLIVFTTRFRQQKEYIIFGATFLNEVLHGSVYVLDGVQRLLVYARNLCKSVIF